MTTRRKIVLLIVTLFSALALTILLAPVWFNLDRYRPQIIS
jgi:hypothetical protein